VGDRSIEHDLVLFSQARLGCVSPQTLFEYVFCWEFILKEVCTCLIYMDLRLRVACYWLNFIFKSRLVLIILYDHMCVIKVGPDYEF